MDQVLDKVLNIQALNSHRKELADFGVEKIGLFGSCYKYETHLESAIEAY